jgi:hypothetical protein
MKKAMLFFVALFFSVAANAATYTVTSGADTVFFNGTEAISANFDSAPRTIVVDVVDGGPTAFDFDYSPTALFASATVDIYEGATLIFDDLVLSADFNMVLAMIDATYTFEFTVSPAEGGMTMGLSSVPVPAAAWLFAPALLGLVG